MTYDVIVVGSGSAGLAAAIAAAESGAKTLMIEKNPALGGTSGWSVGSITTSSSPHQRAADIYDTPEDHFADMGLFHGERLKGRDNLKLRRLLVDNTPPTFDWLLSLGLVFYGPVPEPPHIQPRMHNILPNSRMLIHHLSKHARKLGVEIRVSAPMNGLLTENGRVTGIVVSGKTIAASMGVVLAAGDFSANKKLKQRYMPPEVARIGAFNETSTGDWHDPVTALGGRVLNGDVALGPEIRFRPPEKMTLVRKLPPWLWLARLVRWSIYHMPARLLRPMILGFLTTALMPSLALYRQGALLINRDGDRFSDEIDSPSDNMPAQPDGEAYVVMDANLADAFQAWPNFISTAPGIAYAYLDDYRRNRPDIFFQADTLAGLAGKIGMDPQKLEKSVADYNATQANGARQPMQNPPFIALGPVCAYIMATDGGLAVNENLQVLGENDAPIPGLYAAGSTGQGGLLLEGHGHHLGWGFTSGRIAGRHAATAGQN
jgi:succinate dehydrogenase/fumarate reductase flavoprotein subunit